MTEGYNDRLRAYIEAAILEQAPTWESLFDSGTGQVVGVPDAAIVAAMAASRFRLLYEQDPSRRLDDWRDPGVQQAAALDYTETALSEAWIVLRDIAAGHKYPSRYAANLLTAHGHNLDGQVDPTPHVCQFCETPLAQHWWDPCTYTKPQDR